MKIPALRGSPCAGLLPFMSLHVTSRSRCLTAGKNGLEIITVMALRVSPNFFMGLYCIQSSDMDVMETKAVRCW